MKLFSKQVSTRKAAWIVIPLIIFGYAMDAFSPAGEEIQVQSREEVVAGELQVVVTVTSVWHAQQAIGIAKRYVEKEYPDKKCDCITDDRECIRNDEGEYEIRFRIT